MHKFPTMSVITIYGNHVLIKKILKPQDRKEHDTIREIVKDLK